jgi:hypothetical protein
MLHITGNQLRSARAIRDADVCPVTVEKTKKRHGERGPGRKTLLTRAALDAAAAHPDLTPGEFLLGVMRDPKADTRWRMDAAKALLPKQTGAPGADSDLRKVIEIAPVDKAKIEAAEQRHDELCLGKFLAGELLTPAEQTELARLEAWLATVPPHLKSSGDDPVLVEFCAEPVHGEFVNPRKTGAVPGQQPCELPISCYRRDR